MKDGEEEKRYKPIGKKGNQIRRSVRKSPIPNRSYLLPYLYAACNANAPLLARLDAHAHWKSYLTLASPFNLLSTSSLSPFAAACTFASSFSAPSAAAANTRSTSVYGIMTAFDRLLGNNSGGVDYPSDALLRDKEKLTSRNTCLVQAIASPIQPYLTARPIQASASRSISM